MASFSRVYSQCQMNPCELSEIMSIMAQENFGGGSFSIGTGAISPGVSTLDIDENYVPMCFGNISEFDTTQPDFGLTPPPPPPLPPPIMTMFPGQPQLDILDTADPELKLEYQKMELRDCGAIAANVHHNIGGGSQLFDTHEIGEDCCGCKFKSILMPVSLGSGENWGQRSSRTTTTTEPNMKVGRYTEEERKGRILRYLKKRNQRNFNKTIKYACRKILADRRVRVRGRFAKNDELCKEKSTQNINDDNCHLQNGSYYDEDQIRMDDDEEWLQEVVASFLHVPSIAG